MIFSSSDLPDHLDDRERFHLWREIYRAEIGAVEFATADNVPFHAVIEVTAIGPVTYARSEGTLCRLQRGKEDVRKDIAETYSLTINMGRERVMCAYGEKVFDLRAGGAFIDAQEPQTIIGGDYNRGANVVIARSVLDASYTGMASRQGMVIDPESEALRLMRNYLRMLDASPASTRPSLIDHVAETMIDLFALAAGAKGDEAQLAGMRGLRAARLEAVLAYLRHNYTRPGLSAQEAASHVGLSGRYVQDLLASTGESFSERLLELRLQHARQLLGAAVSRSLRIGDIVFDSGFGDVSYFNRCFRRRFGCSPGAAR